MVAEAPTTCPPSYERGHELREGKFWRNLDRGSVKKRYHDDPKDPPEFGYKFDPRPDKWRWMDEDAQGGLSVNLASCVAPRNSNLLHPEPKRFGHVVGIDLAALSRQIGTVLLAQYTPVRAPAPPPENPCHFDILPESERMVDVLVKLKWLATGEWPKKVPTTPTDRTRALECQTRWESIFYPIIDLADGVAIGEAGM